MLSIRFEKTEILNLRKTGILKLRKTEILKLRKPEILKLRKTKILNLRTPGNLNLRNLEIYLCLDAEQRKYRLDGESKSTQTQKQPLLKKISQRSRAVGACTTASVVLFLGLEVFSGVVSASNKMAG